MARPEAGLLARVGATPLVEIPLVREVSPAARLFAKLEGEARKAIHEDGADVIVLGSTTMHQSHAYLREQLPVPVINPGLVAYKLCELFLDLGLSHSKTAYPSPEIVQDENLWGQT